MLSITVTFCVAPKEAPLQQRDVALRSQTFKSSPLLLRLGLCPACVKLKVSWLDGWVTLYSNATEREDESEGSVVMVDPRKVSPCWVEWRRERLSLKSSRQHFLIAKCHFHSRVSWPAGEHL